MPPVSPFRPGGVGSDRECVTALDFTRLLKGSSREIDGDGISASPALANLCYSLGGRAKRGLNVSRALLIRLKKSGLHRAAVMSFTDQTPPH